MALQNVKEFIIAEAVLSNCSSEVENIDFARGCPIKLLIGSKEQLEDALFNSEDSDTLNTSFVERHNLTIRQGSSYLRRRTIAHGRWPHRLQEHLELLRCYYNFIRPHMALQFGTIRRTPAMQAGLTSKPLTFRQIFTSTALIVFVIWARNQSVLTNQRKAA